MQRGIGKQVQRKLCIFSILSAEMLGTRVMYFYLFVIDDDVRTFERSIYRHCIAG